MGGNCSRALGYIAPCSKIRYDVSMLDLGSLRDPACTRCRFHTDAAQVCSLGWPSARRPIMVVSKMPNSKTYQTDLENVLAEVGVDLRKVFFSSALKCQNFERNASNGDVKTCARSFLDAEIELIRPKYILALGNEALLALTGHSGIMKHRGRVIERAGATIVPTISPSAVQRNPGQRQGYVADLRLFANEINGVDGSLLAPETKIIDTLEKLKILEKILHRASTLVYDIESVDPGTEFHPDARMVSISFTFIYVTKGKKKLATVAIPLYHPESPFLRKWKAVLKFLAPVLEGIPVHMGHNTKYDARWCRQFGVQMRTDHDSLLMAHALDENRQKGLKPQAQSRLGVPPWGIDTKSLLDTPLTDVLEYNGKDTFYTYHISKQMLAELREKPRQLKIYQNLLMPACEEYVAAERRGVWMDRERLATRTKIAADTRDDLESQLMEWVPEAGTEGWPTLGKREKPAEINFNASNWARWWLFDYLKMPVLARGKEKDDGSPGAPSMAEAVVQNLTEATEHPALVLLAERSKWQKYCSSFLGTYEEQLDENDRIHTTYKLHGTVTGRTSSGKVDEEKLTAQRSQRRRGVNLQQVPRDPFIRGIFGAPPGYLFVEADYSQIELRLAAFCAQERRMLHLYAAGIDLHLATAAQTTGKPLSQVTKEERKKAKPTNFGFLYGMSWAKFILTAWQNYGIHFSPDEAEATRVAFFQAYPDLLVWHAKQRRLVKQFGRVESPMGRVRHLPDIYSPDRGVQAEAERQAINSPVQAMASDMLIFGMTLVAEQFRLQNVDAQVIGTVHDACNFQIHEKHMARALPLIKHTFETLPMEEAFGVRLNVPIIADLKAGHHWGDAVELSEDHVYDWRGLDVVSA